MGLIGPSAAPVLETARLILRPFRREDFASLCRLWSHPEVVRHTIGRPATPDEAWGRLLRYLGLWQALGFGYWAVTLKESNTHIGDAGIADFHRPLVPLIIGEGEAGWVFDPAFHGQGYALEAMEAVLAWCDATRPDLSLAAIISPENLASIRLAEKLRFAYAGEAKLSGQAIGLFRRALISR